MRQFFISVLLFQTLVFWLPYKFSHSAHLIVSAISIFFGRSLQCINNIVIHFLSHNYFNNTRNTRNNYFVIYQLQYRVHTVNIAKMYRKTYIIYTYKPHMYIAKVDPGELLLPAGVGWLRSNRVVGSRKTRKINRTYRIVYERETVFHRLSSSRLEGRIEESLPSPPPPQHHPKIKKIKKYPSVYL